jgi:hypothetical protein
VPELPPPSSLAAVPAAAASGLRTTDPPPFVTVLALGVEPEPEVDFGAADADRVELPAGVEARVLPEDPDLDPVPDDVPPERSVWCLARRADADDVLPHVTGAKATV